jgi:hypothetical protein
MPGMGTAAEFKFAQRSVMSQPKGSVSFVRAPNSRNVFAVFTLLRVNFLGVAGHWRLSVAGVRLDACLSSRHRLVMVGAMFGSMCGVMEAVNISMFCRGLFPCKGAFLRKSHSRRACPSERSAGQDCFPHRRTISLLIIGEFCAPLAGNSTSFGLILSSWP